MGNGRSRRGRPPGATADGDLIGRAADGDETAWSTLFDRHWAPAYRVALSLVDRHEDAEDAEDVAQEALLVSLRLLDEGAVPRHFEAWFMRIVWTRALNHRRREKLRRCDPIPSSTECRRSPSPEEEAARSEFLVALRDRLEDLPPQRRQAFLMHDLEGWKHREIAAELGLRSGTARSHVSLARRALRASLVAYTPGIGDGTAISSGHGTSPGGT